MNEDKNEKKNPSNSLFKDYAPYLGLGIQLAATVGVMVFVGMWIDKKLDTSPYFTLIFSVLGIITGLYHFLKSVIKIDK